MAYTGSFSCLVRVVRPEMWSLCSWVTSTPLREAGSTPRLFSAVVIRRAEMPASTSRWVAPQLTSAQFPLEPLASVVYVSTENFPHS